MAGLVLVAGSAWAEPPAEHPCGYYLDLLDPHGHRLIDIGGYRGHARHITPGARDDYVLHGDSASLLLTVRFERCADTAPVHLSCELKRDRPPTEEEREQEKAAEWKRSPLPPSQAHWLATAPEFEWTGQPVLTADEWSEITIETKEGADLKLRLILQHPGKPKKEE